MQVGRREKMYSPRIRTFALTLHFYSPRGYRYVRSVFNKNLPSISTIRKWYSSINGKPGYSKEAFTALRCKALEANREGREMLCCLVFDEISIRKQEEYDHTTDTKTGYVTYGSNTGSTLAKEALVFMITGINEKFKIPVAYFLIAGLKANEKAALIQNVILLAGKSGVKIVGIGYDGLVTNIATAKVMGASFNQPNKAFFINPHGDEKIFLFPDACHSLKTTRNRLASLGVLYDENNNKIEWRYIVELEKYQRDHGINLVTKLQRPIFSGKKSI